MVIKYWLTSRTQRAGSCRKYDLPGLQIRLELFFHFPALIMFNIYDSHCVVRVRLIFWTMKLSHGWTRWISLAGKYTIFVQMRSAPALSWCDLLCPLQLSTYSNLLWWFGSGQTARGLQSHCGITAWPFHPSEAVPSATPSTLSATLRIRQLWFLFWKTKISASLLESWPPITGTGALNPSSQLIPTACLTSCSPENSSVRLLSILNTKWVSSAFSTLFSLMIQFPSKPHMLYKWEATATLISLSFCGLNFCFR